jgi:hypothetical protein
MGKKPSKLVGMTIEAFDSLLKSGDEVLVRKARLIPFYKPGDEMAIASILLAALRLVNEFRSHVFKTIGLSRSVKTRYYAEAEFKLFDSQRVDGLIIVVKGKKIVDAVLVEVKNKNVDLDASQIQRYLEIAKAYGIPRLLTVSNQFVSFPTQSPVSVRVPKTISLFHLSWSYLLTIAHILLAEKELSIDDQDQVEIMKEVVQYFESPQSGIVGRSQMKSGWVEVSQKANSGTTLKQSEECVEETVYSWLQEERDIALILSRELGLLVDSGKTKFKHDLTGRVKAEKKQLVSEKALFSTLQIKDAATSLDVAVMFATKNVAMSSSLRPPSSKRARGQISWLRNQLLRAERMSPDVFERIKDSLFIDLNLKFVKQPVRIPWAELEYAHDHVAGRDIKAFTVVHQRFLGRRFESRKNVIVDIESMVLDFYQGVLQYLKKWENPAPKLKARKEESDAR